MSGFSLSTEEVDAVCARMRAHTDGIHDRLTAVDAGTAEAGPDDFGGEGNAGLARLYAEVITELIPASVHGYRDAAGTMTDRLQDVLRTYRSGDEDMADSLKRITADDL